MPALKLATLSDQRTNAVIPAKTLVSKAAGATAATASVPTILLEVEKPANNPSIRVKTPDVTLDEDFLPDVKILKTVSVDCLPEPEEILKISTQKRIIVGLSGVSCGGKTTVSKALQTWLGDFGDLIMQDDFYKPASELPINTITNFPEFDEPEAVKMDEVRDAILAWKLNGNGLDLNGNDERRVLIVEGTMIFTNKEIVELCDLRYMIHVDYKTAEYRRSLRRYPIPDPPLIVARNIWPKYIKHRHVFSLIARENGLVSKQIDGTVPVANIVAGIIQDVKLSKHE